MFECRECGGFELPGAIYCSGCGSFLLEAEQEPDGSRHPFSDIPGPPAEPVLLGQEMNPVTEAKTITFVIPSSGRRVKLPLQGDIGIGRADPEKERQPQLDLTADQGAALGVSRYHAKVSPSPEGVVVIDLGSTNGTLLNNYRLPADLPYPLHSGDEIRFGHLLVHVFLE